MGHPGVDSPISGKGWSWNRTTQVLASSTPSVRSSCRQGSQLGVATFSFTLATEFGKAQSFSCMLMDFSIIQTNGSAVLDKVDGGSTGRPDEGVPPTSPLSSPAPYWLPGARGPVLDVEFLRTYKQPCSSRAKFWVSGSPPSASQRLAARHVLGGWSPRP